VAVLIVPKLDDEPWPTLGPQIEQLLIEASIFGPGSLKGKPYELDAEKRAALYRMYEVYPAWHEWAGRRRFKRVGISWRKGLAKTEFMAQIAYMELHPDGPVRCDGFDAYGNPVGRPVVDPYIPLLAAQKDQVEELAYGALFTIVTEGPDGDLFDATLERIIRLSPQGRDDGKAVPLANNPSARDGARTTFQGFDEPHRLFLPRQVEAHETMVANLEKRVLEDPWGLYVGTAGEPGQDSIAEGLHQEAEQIERGEITDPQLFYFHREAGPGYDMTKLEDRVEAVKEATGPAGEYGPGQFVSIARQWDRPKADKKYLERVWTNRWTRSEEQAFDPKRRLELLTSTKIRRGAFVTAGFDGARFRDSTGIVITDIPTGRQRLWGLWERPHDLAEDAVWEIDEAEVTESVEKLMTDLRVWRFNADPPHWTETVGSWAGRWDCVEEWWTSRKLPMARAVRSYWEAMASGAVTFVNEGEHADASDDPMEVLFARHMAAAGRRDVNLWDDDGRRLFILKKLHQDRKFDGQMAAILSWEGRLAALKANAKPPARKKRATVRRIR
jgi:hypothetical protein